MPAKVLQFDRTNELELLCPSCQQFVPAPEHVFICVKCRERHCVICAYPDCTDNPFTPEPESAQDARQRQADSHWAASET